VKFLTAKDRANAARQKESAGRRSRPIQRRRSKKIKYYDPLATYINLKCGHLTTIEDIERYHAWQKDPHKFLCEQCGTWVEQVPRKPPAEIPDIPLF